MSPGTALCPVPYRRAGHSLTSDSGVRPRCRLSGMAEGVEGGADVGNRGSGVGARRKPDATQPALRVDDCIGAQLAGVLGGGPQPAPASQEPGIHRDRARRPHLSHRSPTGAEQAVQLAVDLGEQRHVEVEVVPVSGEPRVVAGEGDHDGEDVGLAVEVIAHGDHVFLAGQSSEVAVQDHHEEPLAMFAEPPRLPFVVDEGEIGERVTFADHVVGFHVCIMRDRGGRLPLHGGTSGRRRSSIGVPRAACLGDHHAVEDCFRHVHRNPADGSRHSGTGSARTWPDRRGRDRTGGRVSFDDDPGGRTT